MSNESVKGDYRGFLEKQMELWSQRLLEVEASATAGGTDDERRQHAATLERMKAARSSLGQILAGLGADRMAVAEASRAQAQAVIGELGDLWVRCRDAKIKS